MMASGQNGEKQTHRKELVAMCRQTADHGSKEQRSYPYPRTDSRAFTVILNVSITGKQKIKELHTIEVHREQLT